MSKRLTDIEVTRVARQIALHFDVVCIHEIMAYCVHEWNKCREESPL